MANARRSKKGAMVRRAAFLVASNKAPGLGSLRESERHDNGYTDSLCPSFSLPEWTWHAVDVCLGRYISWIRPAIESGASRLCVTAGVEVPASFSGLAGL
jgi:hypothetical protein